MALTAAQLAQNALNVAKPIQDAINNGTGINERAAIHDLAGAVALLAEAVLNSGPSSANVGGTYANTNTPGTTVVSTKGR